MTFALALETGVTKKHPDRHFVQNLFDGIKHGFHTMVSKKNLPTVECKNLQSAFRNPDIVDNLIKQQVEKPPFDMYRVSPIGIVEGKYSGSFLHARCFILILFAKYSFLTFEIHDLCLNLQSFHLHVP
jgi:hypothetical protein